ncbi:unnamed protein product [Rhizophagus irregularis]|nr:unnamed protein product [Rhizophagus irregularis]
MKLSDLQRKEHKRSLPKIRSFLEDRRSEFEEKLNALPLPLDTNSIIHYLSNKVMNTQVPLLAAIAGTISPSPKFIFNKLYITTLPSFYPSFIHW